MFAKHPSLDGGMLYRRLKEKGVLIRHFDKPRLYDHNRITVGTKEQIDVLIEKIIEITEEQHEDR